MLEGNTIQIGICDTERFDHISEAARRSVGGETNVDRCDPGPPKHRSRCRKGWYAGLRTRSTVGDRSQIEVEAGNGSRAKTELAHRSKEKREAKGFLLIAQKAARLDILSVDGASRNSNFAQHSERNDSETSHVSTITKFEISITRQSNHKMLDFLRGGHLNLKNCGLIAAMLLSFSAQLASASRVVSNSSYGAKFQLLSAALHLFVDGILYCRFR